MLICHTFSQLFLVKEGRKVFFLKQTVISHFYYLFVEPGPYAYWASIIPLRYSLSPILLF